MDSVMPYVIVAGILVGLLVNFVTLSKLFVQIGRLVERMAVHGEQISANTKAMDSIKVEQSNVDEKYLAKFAEMEKKLEQVWKQLSSMKTTIEVIQVQQGSTNGKRKR